MLTINFKQKSRLHCIETIPYRTVVSRTFHSTNGGSHSHEIIHLQSFENIYCLVTNFMIISLQKIGPACSLQFSRRNTFKCRLYIQSFVLFNSVCSQGAERYLDVNSLLKKRKYDEKEKELGLFILLIILNTL